MSQPYNTTELDPDTTFERHVYHRDQFAHYLDVYKRQVDDNIPVIDVATGLPVVETSVDASGEAMTPKIETLDLDAMPENSNPKVVPF